MSFDDDRIAIVGMACRVPGAPDLTTFWRNVCGSVDSIRRFASSSNDPSFVPAFGYLDQLTDFDAALFGYSDEEAALLDPQHRIFLEMAWWAMEDAAYDPTRGEAQVGVFAGCGANRYLRYHLLGNPALQRGPLPDDWDEVLAGATSDYLPLRVAYALGLTGPAVAVQTACSSSLVAVCQAAQSLLDFRCDMAIAGGAAVVSTRQSGYRYRPGGTWATDGICRPFDGDATGQVFGNGGGAVVLKRLGDAIADNDHVYGVLGGWAVNNDGAARAGFTAPGVAGQAAVVAEALAAAEWDAATVGFVEGHGSGTPVGDAIEIDALTRAFRASTSRSGHCSLGSVKANVGNVDAAAGVVGLIKATLAVRHGVIPPTLHFRKPHPEVDLGGSPFTVDTELREWVGQRRAGVSSFGLGGTNAHVLVEQAPVRESQTVAPQAHQLHLSANEPGALVAITRRLAEHLAEKPCDPADVAYTLAVGRRRLPHRATVTYHDTTLLMAIVDEPGAAAPVPEGGKRISLPGYPFQRRRHWFEEVQR
ncbi:MAG TPA: polyketide synthase [Micromonosporaceae bacterium]|nr:polyketide synthase [Micromonosporaceae bacterium]